MSEQKNGNNIVPRLLASVVVVVAYGWLNFLLNPISTVESAKIAGMQLQNSDTAYAASLIGMNFFHNLGIPALLLLAILFWIWWKPMKSLKKRGTISMLILFVTLGGASQVLAFYDKVDRAEAIYILPNESFFWIPDVGENKSSQAKLDSEEYYAANKLSVKRFIIPHVKFQGSNPFWYDYYVPAGRAIIQPRTPYNREWTKDIRTGTSAKNESFPCQTNEGINVTVEMAIGAYVTEDQAPKYLFNFGVKPPKGDRSDPQVIFTSIYFGKDLPEVMDGVIRNKIQTLACNEISARTLNAVNSEANKMLDNISKETTSYCATKGITLDYLGWAGTFTFDNDVQRAVNDRYTAQTVAPYLATLQSKAVIDALNRWDGHAPASISLWTWSGISDFFGRLLKSEPKVSTEAPKTEVNKK
jgi:hypothetical protein